MLEGVSATSSIIRVINFSLLVCGENFFNAQAIYKFSPEVLNEAIQL